MTSELLPCPFCGGEPSVRTDYRSATSNYQVVCDCGATACPRIEREDAKWEWNRRFSVPVRYAG